MQTLEVKAHHDLLLSKEQLLSVIRVENVALLNAHPGLDRTRNSDFVI
jgi:hypothetical protein